MTDEKKWTYVGDQKTKKWTYAEITASVEREIRRLMACAARGRARENRAAISRLGLRRVCRLE